MTNQKKIQLFEHIPVPQAVLTLTVPMVVSSLVMILYNLADTYFVGLLNDPIENSAVTLAAPVLLAFNAINNLFGVGSASMMSRALGVKDHETVTRSASFGLYCALLSGFLFSLAASLLKKPLLTILGANAATTAATGDYLTWTVTFGAIPSILNVVLANLVRAEGSAMHAGIGTMSGCLLNIVLDPLFILPQGLNKGAAGAGLATFLSNCVALIYFLLLLLIKRKQTDIRLSPREFRLSKPLIAGILSVGIPAAIQNLLNVTGMTVLNNFMADYSETAVAAMGIAHKSCMIPMYIAMGIGQGVMPLIGYNFAAKNSSRMKKALLFAMTLSLTITILTTITYFTCSSGIMRLFISNSQIITYGASFIRGQCLAQPFLCIDFLAVGVFQACGMGKKSLLFALLRKIVLEIPALFLLDYFFPMYGLAYAQATAELVLAVAAVWFLVRIFRRLPTHTTSRMNQKEELPCGSDF